MLWAGMILIGCSAPTTTHYGSASIVSEPPNANIVNLKDDSAIGTTPLKYTWENEARDEEYIQLKLTAPGYADQVTSFFLNSRYESKEDAEKIPQAIKVNMEQVK
jgi:hypothetical protein